jgi:GTP-binding protein
MGNMTFTVIDTGGLDDREGLDAQMLPFTHNVLNTADAVLFLVDARRGVTPEDKHFAQYVLTLGRCNDSVCCVKVSSVAVLFVPYAYV